MRGRVASLAIVSAYPPPYGGVSVEVQRLLPLLDRRGLHYVVYNAGSDSKVGDRVVSVYRWRRIWTPWYMLTGKEPAVYLMSDRLMVWILGALAVRFRRRRVLVQLRNAMLPDWVARSPWRCLLAGMALRRMTRVICVSHLLARSAAALGVHGSRIHWSPAFLPPDLSPEDRHNVAPEVWAFAATHRPLLAANGRVWWYGGHDLYGLDHLVELAARLRSDFPDIGIVVCFWDHSPQDEAYLDRLRRRAADNGVGDNLLFNTKSGAFVPVLRAADLFVRPTNTDGDAVSVREALFLGVPVVASDAAERPEGTIAFRTRDVDDLEANVRAVLRRTSPGAGHRPMGLSQEDRQRIDAYVDLLAAIAEGRDESARPSASS